MLRRKLGILFLAGVTVLAGTQEARRQFDGLRSSLNSLTRASLWSGLIVYAQPVSDGKLPTPQIYYLMPQTPHAPAAAPHQALLADNRFDAAAAKPATRNNHVAEEAAIAAVTESLTPTLPSLLPLREIEDAAKSELILDKLPEHVVAAHIAAAHFAAPKPERVRVYEEVARHVPVARRLRHDADVIARVFVKEHDAAELSRELDAAKLNEELARLAATQEQLETPKLKSFADAEMVRRRLEFKVMRHPARIERPERLKVAAPSAGKRVIALPEISSIGCEKTTNKIKTKAAKADSAAAATAAAVVGVLKSVIIPGEPPVAVELAAPAAAAAPLSSSTSWALGCDTEPEYK
jgi:hypothetical protein